MSGGCDTTSTASAEANPMNVVDATEGKHASPIFVREQALLGVCALLCAASAVVTIVWCGRMSAMGGMEMPGGWTLSMMWMRMPGQTWPGAAASFLGMWVVMMMAMMLPSLVPILARHRQALAEINEIRRGWLTAVMGASYFFVWTLLGLIVFPLGVLTGRVVVQFVDLSRAVPFVSGIAILVAGVLQFTRWKSYHLACCREARSRRVAFATNSRTAWQAGLRLGLHCTYCCASLTMILFVMGMMDLRAMAVVTAAITAERLAPAGERVARAIGWMAVAAGLFLIARAAAVG